MQTKNVEKLEDLNGFEWDHNGRTLTIKYDKRFDSILIHLQSFMRYDHEIINRYLFTLVKETLDELRFIGLEVVLIEKPKLTQKERYFLELLDDDTSIIRDSKGNLYAIDNEPLMTNNTIELKKDFFSFIENKRLCSRQELLELEVEVAIDPFSPPFPAKKI